MVKALLYRDFRNIINFYKTSKYKLKIFILMIIYAVFIAFGQLNEATTILSLFIFLPFISICSLDEEDESGKFLSICPIEKRDIVNSKFLILTVMGILAFVVNTVVFLMLRNINGYILEDYINLVFRVVILWASYYAYMAMVYKYGTRKAMNAVLIRFFLFSLIFVCIILSVTRVLNLELIKRILPISIILSLVLVVVISYIISIKTLKDKEY